MPGLPGVPLDEAEPWRSPRASRTPTAVRDRARSRSGAEAGAGRPDPLGPVSGEESGPARRPSGSRRSRAARDSPRARRPPPSGRTRRRRRAAWAFLPVRKWAGSSRRRWTGRPHRGPLRRRRTSAVRLSTREEYTLASPAGERDTRPATHVWPRSRACARGLARGKRTSHPPWLHAVGAGRRAAPRFFASDR